MKIRLHVAKSKGSPTFLVYQMGKIGSTSIDHSLTEHGLFTIHIHTLRKSFIPLSANWPPDHNHQIRTDVANKILAKQLEVKIITGVRDPVARNISAFFQNLSSFGFDPQQIGLQDTEALISRFFSDFPHTRSLEWFDTEICHCLGIDVFKYEFSGDYRIIQGIRPLLILKTEADDAKKERGIQEFTGHKLHLLRKNVGGQKAYSEVYRAFVGKIKFTKHYLDTMYNSKYCRHFYTQKEIKDFRAKWENGSVDIS